jgi:hypothetical protein
LAQTANVPFQFGQDVYNKAYTTDAGQKINTLAKTPTTPFNFNPANIYQAPIVAGQMRELFPSFGESKRLAQGLINERPTTQSIVDMIRGVPANPNLGLQTMQSNVVGAPTSLNNVLGLIAK